MTRKSLYILTLSASGIGYLWVFFQYILRQEESSSMEGICLIKTTTGIPCPSCGSTRSVVSLFEGQVLEALYWNPIGLLIAIMLIVIPIWVVLDLIRSQSTFHNAYLKMETFFQNKLVVGVFILLILTNWIWNINKGL